MPNHTTNHLRITGPEATIKKMKEFAKSKEEAFSCQSILPMPQELQNTVKGCRFNKETIQETHDREQREAKYVEKYGCDNWYDWHVANWGTKWDVYSWDKPLEWKNETDGVSMVFYSAWSPPLSVIAKLARCFPDLTLVVDYSDEGGGYAGQNVYCGETCDESYFADPILIEAKQQEMGLIEE